MLSVHILNWSFLLQGSGWRNIPWLGSFWWWKQREKYMTDLPGPCLEVTSINSACISLAKASHVATWVKQWRCAPSSHREKHFGESKPKFFAKIKIIFPKMGLQLVLIVSKLTYFGLVLCMAQICSWMFRFLCVNFDEGIYCPK